VPVLNRPAVAIEKVSTAEKGVIWALVHDPKAGVQAAASMDVEDLDGLPARQILEQARSLQEWPIDAVPEALLERLSKMEAGLVQEIGRQSHPPGEPLDCVRALKRLRFTRERADVQRQIVRLQEEGGANHEIEIVALWERKKILLQQIETLMGAETR